MPDWLPTAISAVIFLGAAAVYLRGSRDKGTIATLTASNAALTERVKILETSDAAKTAEISGLVASNLTLQNTVNSSELIVDLRDAVLTALDDHHNAAMTGLEHVGDVLETLPGQLAVALREGR
jgi:hypothetical protein